MILCVSIDAGQVVGKEMNTNELWSLMLWMSDNFAYECPLQYSSRICINKK
jgi:hypothetical protein